MGHDFRHNMTYGGPHCVAGHECTARHYHSMIQDTLSPVRAHEVLHSHQLLLLLVAAAWEMQPCTISLCHISAMDHMHYSLSFQCLAVHCLIATWCGVGDCLQKIPVLVLVDIRQHRQPRQHSPKPVLLPASTACGHCAGCSYIASCVLACNDSTVLLHDRHNMSRLTEQACT